MNFTELSTFSVAHHELPWPWIAFAATGDRFAALAASQRVATWTLADDQIVEGPSFALPADFVAQGFAIEGTGTLLAAHDGKSVLTLDATGVVRRSTLADVLASAPSADAAIRCVAFDRRGTRVWVSADAADASWLALVDARTHASHGFVRSAAFVPPAVHELFVHPTDDAVLLLAACGPDGTFARVAGFTDGPVVLVETALDGGAVAAGFAGFSGDGALVFLAEADELRTHAWPGLQQLASVDLADGFVSSFTGVVRGGVVLVDGVDDESGDDAVMQFDRAGLVGARARPPIPPGMWAGALGRDCLVTVDAKGEPATARVLRIGVLPATN